VEAEINNMKSATTGFSPNEIWFTYPVRELSDFLFETRPKEIEYPTVQEMCQNAEKVHKQVLKKTIVQRNRQKQQYDKDAAIPNWKLGDKVLIFNPKTVDSKIQPNYAGIYVIKEIDWAYYRVMVREIGGKRQFRVPMDHLRPANNLEFERKPKPKATRGRPRKKKIESDDSDDEIMPFVPDLNEFPALPATERQASEAEIGKEPAAPEDNEAESRREPAAPAENQATSISDRMRFIEEGHSADIMPRQASEESAEVLRRPSLPAPTQLRSISPILEGLKEALVRQNSAPTRIAKPNAKNAKETTIRRSDRVKRPPKRYGT
jgi:ribosomal protein L21E